MYMLLNTLEGHSGFVASVAISSDNTKPLDNSKVVSGSMEGTINAWSSGTSQGKYYLSYKFDSSFRSITVSKSKNLITGDSNGNLHAGILYS